MRCYLNYEIPTSLAHRLSKHHCNTDISSFHLFILRSPKPSVLFLLFYSVETLRRKNYLFRKSKPLSLVFHCWTSSPHKFCLWGRRLLPVRVFSHQQWCQCIFSPDWRPFWVPQTSCHLQTQPSWKRVVYTEQNISIYFWAMIDW